MRKKNTQILRIARKNYTQFWRASIVGHDAIIHSDDIISQRSSKQYNPVPILRERLLKGILSGIRKAPTSAKAEMDARLQ